MAGEETRCPWCGGVILKTEAKTKSEPKNFGTVMERRCPRCGKVLAAYLENEGEFLPKIRTF